jgi:hypothetical protein
VYLVADPSHWDDHYETIGAGSVSWHQNRPAPSLELLAPLDVEPDQSLIDIGVGASNLVDHLWTAGSLNDTCCA